MKQAVLCLHGFIARSSAGIQRVDDSEMQPQKEEVQPENNGLSDSDMELLQLLKSLTPEMKEMLLKQSASK